MPTQKQLEKMATNAAFVRHWYSKDVQCLEDFIEVASADPVVTKHFSFDGTVDKVATKCRQKILTLVLGMTGTQRDDRSHNPRISDCADFIKRGKDDNPRWYARKLDRRDVTSSGGVEEFNQAILDEHYPSVDFAWWKQG